MSKVKNYSDNTIWFKAANKMYRIISHIESGMSFKEFNFIALHNIYLLASFLYYHYDTSPMSDNKFDMLCKYLLEHYEEVEKVVWYKDKTLSKDRLSAGTGYDIEITPIWHGIIQHYQRI